MNNTSKLFMLLFVLAVAGILWLKPDTSTDKTVTGQASEQQNNSVETTLYDELYERINNLESESFQQQAINQKLAVRLGKLEKKSLSATRLDTDNQSTNSNSKGNPDTEIEPEPEQNMETRLLNAGIHLDTILQIQSQIDQNRIDRLELRNQAIREKWIQEDRFRQLMGALNNTDENIRNDFGDEVFDQYLFASEQNNRVVVSEVFNGSAAQVAGFEPGDIILTYASESIFTAADIQQATVEGVAGDNVLVELIRNGTSFTTTVIRGPLGISMVMTSQPPG